MTHPVARHRGCCERRRAAAIVDRRQIRRRRGFALFLVEA